MPGLVPTLPYLHGSHDLGHLWPPLSGPGHRTCLHQAASVLLERAHRPRKGTVEARRATQFHRKEATAEPYRSGAALPRTCSPPYCGRADNFCSLVNTGLRWQPVIFKCRPQATTDCLIGLWHWPGMSGRKADVRGSQEMRSQALPRYLCSQLPAEEGARAGSQGYHGAFLPLDPISHRGQRTELIILAQLGVMVHTLQTNT